MAANAWQLHHGAGPRYAYWLSQTIRGLERAVLDDRPEAD